MAALELDHVPVHLTVAYLTDRLVELVDDLNYPVAPGAPVLVRWLGRFSVSII